MAKSKNIYKSQRKKKHKKFHQRKGFILLLGIAIGIIFIGAFIKLQYIFLPTNRA